ncbi:Histidine kinase-like ATPase, C-terminal domain containing protein [Parasponia andersonii]|uniref:Histidine kinase-like ATPase, C-terminal domain containing protein n=1 Tax=Parasponia andersonii TaxID=3476 RepID=A0A2P5B7Q4_PARAD|nr:Histidine kinase-like ATPase, C-terminal domain containing protein [Parasponia andersonii]
MRFPSPYHFVEELSGSAEIHVGRRDSVTNEDFHSSDHKLSETFRDQSHLSTSGGSLPCVQKQNELLEKNYVRADPSYLKTLGQAHSAWIFGAIAELVDNARDAKATKLQISVEMIYSKRAGKDIPLLTVIDDGHGMSHQDVMIMTCFGHKQPEEDKSERIGRFGVGFKVRSGLSMDASW